MAQVLQELYNYTFAPTNAVAAVGEDNPLSPNGENVGWELAPEDEADDGTGAAQTQPIGG
ncbi:MAG TPA: hypothetical protein ACQGQI_08500 [Xylella sp.]